MTPDDELDVRVRALEAERLRPIPPLPGVDKKAHRKSTPRRRAVHSPKRPLPTGSPTSDPQPETPTVEQPDNPSADSIDTQEGDT